MEYLDYLAQVRQKFSASPKVEISEISPTSVFYEEIFKMEWLFTKMKIHSFLTYAEAVDGNYINQYTKYWMGYALKNHRGLPRGLQNGVIANNVVVSHHVDPSAIQFVQARPPKHYSAFEMPVVVDLANACLHYYRGGIVWGAIYDSFIKCYIDGHFGL